MLLNREIMLRIKQGESEANGKGGILIDLETLKGN